MNLLLLLDGQMIVEDAVEIVDEGFDTIRNYGAYFSIDKRALYKSNLRQLNFKNAVEKIIK